MVRSSKQTACVFWILVVISCFGLSGCGTELTQPYTLSSFDASSVLDAESDLKAGGFASALCVPSEESSQINTDGVTADSFALFNMTDGTVISQNNVYDRMYPASTTKILTCLIALERGNLDDTVTIPQESAITVSGSSMADLRPGDQLSLRDLLYGLMVPSGNDAAVAVANYISGGVESFAALMNERANELGATQSHFVNPHGLPDEEHYTTVYDMYLIFNEALKNPQFLEIANQPQYTARVTAADGSVREVTWSNGNQFYTRYSLPEGYSILAGKTGHTSAAGFCLVLGEESADGKQYASIVFKAPTIENLYQGMENLIDKSLS